VRSQATINGAAAVFYLIYRSSARLGRKRATREAAIERILSESRLKNSRLAITGVLFFSGRSFIQHLEGPQAHVESTFDCIEQDVRHTNVQVVHRGWQEQRQYGSWSMIYIGRDTTASAGRVASLVDTSDMAAASGPVMASILHNVVDDYLAGP
jgi:hypothetical protein